MAKLSGTISGIHGSWGFVCWRLNADLRLPLKQVNNRINLHLSKQTLRFRKGGKPQTVKNQQVDCMWDRWGKTEGNCGSTGWHVSPYPSIYLTYPVYPMYGWVGTCGPSCTMGLCQWPRLLFYICCFWELFTGRGKRAKTIWASWVKQL